MNKTLRIPDYLEHIRDAIDKIFNYVKDSSEAEFMASGLIQDAVIRNFEIMGEASKNILRADPNFANNEPKLPLIYAIGMRNTLSHGYLDVRLDVIWKAIREDLADFRERVEVFLKAVGETPGDPS